MQLFFVLPVTSATAERSFSTLRRLKTYLRTTMQQERLNNIAILHVHKRETERIDMKTVTDEFACRNDRRRMHFGNPT